MNSHGKLLERKHIYSGRIIEVTSDRVELPNGQETIREVVGHPGGAVAVAQLDDGRILFVRQPRYPLGLELLELPAGKLDPDEDPALTVLRELHEETGYVAARATHLSSFFTSPGFCSERLHLYHMCDLQRGQQKLEHDEMITIEKYHLSEAMEMIKDGRIQDAKTIIGLVWAHYLLPEQSG